MDKHICRQKIFIDTEHEKDFYIKRVAFQKDKTGVIFLGTQESEIYEHG